jgi:hypothetical protein
MGIISGKPETIKTSNGFSNSDRFDIDDTATELLDLQEFVVESYDIDGLRKEARFYCRIRFDYSICPRCSSASEDVHQRNKRRCVRDMMR